MLSSGDEAHENACLPGKKWRLTHKTEYFFSPYTSDFRRTDFQNLTWLHALNFHRAIRGWAFKALPHL